MCVILRFLIGASSRVFVETAQTFLMLLISVPPPPPPVPDDHGGVTAHSAASSSGSPAIHAVLEHLLPNHETDLATSAVPTKIVSQVFVPDFCLRLN